MILLMLLVVVLFGFSGLVGASPSSLLWLCAPWGADFVNLLFGFWLWLWAPLGADVVHLCVFFVALVVCPCGG